MLFYSYFRKSKPSAEKVPPEKVDAEYRRLRRNTFWGATLAYSLYYVCRMSLSVVKQPMIDSGVLSATDLGLVGSAMLFVYAIGKFINGFIADYCNIRRFMGIGLLISAVLNLVLGLAGAIPGISSTLLFFIFFMLWGVNGWAQSMGSPPGVINLSRWFPLASRGTYYSLFSSTPYVGELLSFIIVGLIVGSAGWQWGFIFAALAGFAGSIVAFLSMSDTPESKGLPPIATIAGEKPREEDSIPTDKLQKKILRHPGIWVIAISSAFIYITKYAVTGWGMLFLQKAKGFTLEGASQVIGFSLFSGILGTVCAGWLSDSLFRGDRVKPTVISGFAALLSLGLFLYGGDSTVMNIVYVSVFSLATGVLYCIVAGLMAVDIVPRKATGAALGIVGVSSYLAAGLQDVVSGVLIDKNMIESAGNELMYNFTPACIFWLIAALLSFLLPVLNWKKMQNSKFEI